MNAPSEEDFKVALVEDADELDEVRRFQAERYLSAGYISELPPNGVIEDEWVGCSDYFVARVPTGEIAGTCRFVPNSPAGLPMLQHFEVEPAWRQLINQSTAYEVGALAVAEKSGNVAVAAFLYRQTVHRFRQSPSDVHLVAALDARLFRAMRRLLHFPFEQVGPAEHYIGSRTIPGYLYLPGAMENVAVKSPDAARFFSQTESLEDALGEVIDLREKYPALSEADSLIDLSDTKIERSSDKFQND